MTAAKAIKSEGSAVIVDTSEFSELPDVVKKAIQGKGSLPMVVFVDPGMQNVYGAFGHSELKGQDYRGVFRDTKRKIRDAKKAGSFVTDLNAAPVEVAAKDAVADDVEIVDIVERVQVEEGEITRWTSSKGKVLMARLVAIEGEESETFVFQTAAGKEIRAEAQHLSDESVERAREMAGQ
jgi:hypothetical protein